MEFTRLQLIPIIGLVALAPVLAYAVVGGRTAAYLSLLNVLLIAGSLYYMLSPAPSELDGGVGH